MDMLKYLVDKAIQRNSTFIRYRGRVLYLDEAKRLLSMKKDSYDGIVIHCSDSSFGNAQMIEDWHKERGWSDIGYHFVILNGRISKDYWLKATDGSIEVGRDMDLVGAHARGYNDWLGICLIGIDTFTDKQFDSLGELIGELMRKYHISLSNVIGHYQCENNGGKTCPNFDVDKFKLAFFGYKD